MRGWTYHSATEAGEVSGGAAGRAVRMVFEAEQYCDTQWQAICSVAEKLGPTAETVRKWVRRVEMRVASRGWRLMEMTQFDRQVGYAASCRPDSVRS